MNQYTACGNLADTPLLRTTPSGRPVTNFLLIVDERLKKNGPRAQMRKERTIAHRIPVVAWGDLAETVTTWLQKGSKINLMGKLQPRKYKDKSGITHDTFEIVAEDIEFLSGIKHNSEVFEEAVSA